MLGPMEVHDEQVDVTPPAAMPRRVLATLLLHADQVVPIPTLIEELWDDEPPRLARKTVQTYVYQLRKALAGGPTGPVRRLLETRPQGYRILLEPGELDLRLFEQRARIGRSALAAGDAGNAASSLREALSVWRGDALTDLVPGPVLSAEASRLEDSRRGVLEQRVEADLRLGRHRDLIGELKALMIRYPGHEEFCAQLMLAAYRAGRRDESLGAYDRLRRVVVDQSGLEPSERLRRLQHAVLVDSPSLALPDQGGAAPAREAPAEIPPGPEHVVGRTHDLALIGASVRRRPATTAPGLVVIAGAPGTGKTTAAVFAAHRLREKFPDGQLYASLHADAGVGLGVDPLTVLQGFLRSVSDDEPPAALEPAARRFRSWSADRRVLVVLDDAASAAQVAPLLPNGRGCATL
ncbi:MAG: AfsR/SARP family transcriptional regulator, partial [Actinocrinis sp.]